MNYLDLRNTFFAGGLSMTLVKGSSTAVVECAAKKPENDHAESTRFGDKNVGERRAPRDAAGRPLR